MVFNEALLQDAMVHEVANFGLHSNSWDPFLANFFHYLFFVNMTTIRRSESEEVWKNTFSVEFDAYEIEI